MRNITITGAREGNLKNISLEIPRGRLVVLTGVSGSGKTTLAMDVLYNECQRQYLEAMAFQGISKPEVESVQGASPAIQISQNGFGRNPRSSVGTVTDIYTDLRMIFEKLGKRTCPFCGSAIYSGECKEETEKLGEDFRVYMYCSSCGRRMNKLTRTWFSFNTREGACPVCQGMGKVMAVREGNVLHEDLSLEEGAVDYWESRYGEYQTQALYAAFSHYGISFQPGTAVKDFTPLQKAILCYGVEDSRVKEAFPDINPPKTVAGGRVEGCFPILWRRLSEKQGNLDKKERYFEERECPECHGERLGKVSRQVTVMDTRLPELAVLSLEELYDWLSRLAGQMKENEAALTRVYVQDLQTKISRLIRAGLGYLSLDRQTGTLSGGEARRLKLAAALDSRISGIIYILDEPTVGLHPKDTAGVMDILKKLKSLGNTVLVIEHDTDVMKEADQIIDIGPGSGRNGGCVVGQGNWDELLLQENSVTGKYLKQPKIYPCCFRTGGPQKLSIRNASIHNLKGIRVDFPTSCLIGVTGVSGSGKSTLIFDVLAKGEGVEGMQYFDRVVTVEQHALTRMKRSNVATYSGVYEGIRKVYASLPEAKKAGLGAGDFSFNSKGGRCENCQGLGYVVSNMLFFEDREVTCPVCGGRQFADPVLAVTYKGRSIHDMLHTSVEEAAELLGEYPKLLAILALLQEVGLGYLELGQTLTTLSGGEGQRLKLAGELSGSRGGRGLYLLDEPTTGLHALDVEHFLKLLNRMVDAGNTVIVVEHNLQLIRCCDYIVDLGPEGGIRGGELVAAGTPLAIMENPRSVTGKYLKKMEE